MLSLFFLSLSLPFRFRLFFQIFFVSFYTLSFLSQHQVLDAARGSLPPPRAFFLVYI